MELDLLAYCSLFYLTGLYKAAFADLTGRLLGILHIFKCNYTLFLTLKPSNGLASL